MKITLEEYQVKLDKMVDKLEDLMTVEEMTPILGQVHYYLTLAKRAVKEALGEVTKAEYETVKNDYFYHTQQLSEEDTMMANMLSYLLENTN